MVYNNMSRVLCCAGDGGGGMILLASSWYSHEIVAVVTASGCVCFCRDHSIFVQRRRDILERVTSL